MRAEGVLRIGTLVRVQKIYSMPELQGWVGTIKQRYGDASYAAYKVQFGVGRSEVLWRHELEEALVQSAQADLPETDLPEGPGSRPRGPAFLRNC